MRPVGSTRGAVARNRPAVLAGFLAGGLALANWIAPAPSLLAAVALVALLGVALAGAGARAVLLALALVALGLWWGGLRLDALAQSTLAGEVGEGGRAQLVVTGAARIGRFSTRVPAEVHSFRGHPLRERVLLLLPPGRAPPRGVVLETNADVRAPRPAEDGGFDERAWLARQGVHVVLQGGEWRRIGRRGGLAGLGDRLRDRVEHALGRGPAGASRAVVLGIVVGEDEGLDPGLRRDFRASGLQHLLAVSGQNVAFLVVGIVGIGWLLRIPRLALEIAALATIGGYVLAVGWQPSVIRAGVAGVLASLAWIAARPRDGWHFLAVGAVVLLGWQPGSLFDPGFQLSFAAVAAIFVGVPRLRAWLGGYPIPPPLAETLAVSIACGAATAPIVLLQFGAVPTYTVLANALAFPAVPVVLGAGLLAGLVEPVLPSAALALAFVAGWSASYITFVAHAVASLPAARLGSEETLAVTVLGVAAALLARRYRLAVRSHSAAVGALVATVVIGAGLWWWLRPPPVWHPPGRFRITFLDVGQGDATLLEAGRAAVLVDEGPPEADVAGQLRRLGFRELTAMVLTHPQRDHVGGAADVLRRLDVGAILDPTLEATGPEREEAVAVARARGVPVTAARSGTVFRAGPLVLRVLWPDDAGTPSEDPNLNAVVLVASVGELDVLLSADAESDVTRRLDLPEVEVMKVAHHGSADPGLPELLERLRPRVAVIQVGAGNDYGHPRAETLHALADVPGLRVFRNDLDGRVVIGSDGKTLTVTTSK